VPFSREFHLDDAMLLWDAVIAENERGTPGGGSRGRGDGKYSGDDGGEPFKLKTIN